MKAPSQSKVAGGATLRLHRYGQSRHSSLMSRFLSPSAAANESSSLHSGQSWQLLVSSFSGVCSRALGRVAKCIAVPNCVLNRTCGDMFHSNRPMLAAGQLARR